MYPRTPKSSFKHAGKPLAPTDIAQAEKFWIMEAQKSIYKDIEQGRYKRCAPKRIQMEYTWLEDGEKGGLR